MKNNSGHLLLAGAITSILALVGTASPAMSQCVQTNTVFGFDTFVDDKFCKTKAVKKPIAKKAVKKAPPKVAKRTPAKIAQPQKTEPAIAAKPDSKIREMQSLLASMGYDPGPLDGYSGPQTEKAASEFNIANDLPKKAATPSTVAVLKGLSGKYASPEIATPIAVPLLQTAKAEPAPVSTPAPVARPVAPAPAPTPVSAPAPAPVATPAPVLAAIAPAAATPAPAPAPVSDRRIRKMQMLLSSMGYNPGRVDGIDSPETRQAAANFNIANELPKKAAIPSTIAVLMGLRGAP